MNAQQKKHVYVSLSKYEPIHKERLKFIGLLCNIFNKYNHQLKLEE